jgi:exonuclease SbcC
MIFKQLQLQNFKSHVNTTIDFQPGISIIVGENGAGKSTIFEAISFALFKQHTAKKINDLIKSSNVHKNNEKMSVKLDFLVNGKEYEIKRSKTKTNSTSELYEKIGDRFQKIVSGDQEVNKEIQAILEMDGELFLNAIYVRQGEIADLVSKTPAQRKQLIGKLLKLEELETAWKNSLPLITEYDKKAAEIKGKLSSETELNYELKTKKQELDNLNKKGSEAELKLEELNKEHDEKATAKGQMETEKGIYEALKTNLANEIDNAKTLMEDKKELQNQADEIVRNEAEMLRLEKYSKKLPIYLEFKDAVNKIKTLKNDENKYNKILEDIEVHKKILEEEKPEYDAYLELEGKIKALEENKSKIEAEISVFKQLESQQKTLETEIENDKKTSDNFFKKAENVISPFLEANDSFEDYHDFNKLKHFVDTLEVNISKEIKTNEELSVEYKKQIVALGEGVKNSKIPLKDLEKVGDKCPICLSDITPQKKMDLQNNYKNIISTNKSKMTELDAQIKEFEIQNKSLESKYNELLEIEKQIYSNKHVAESIEKDTVKLEELNERLRLKDDTSAKLLDIKKQIQEETTNRESKKEHHEKYIESQGALKTLGKEHEAKDELYKITGQTDLQVQTLKKCIANDSYLSAQIQEEDLNQKIDELNKKNERFNQLKGTLHLKKSVNNKLEKKKDDIKIKNQKITKLEEDIKESRYDAEKYNNLLFAYDRLNKQIQEVSQEIGQIKGQVTEIIPAIENLTRKINKNKEYENELANYESYLNLLKEIRNIYGKDGIQKDLRERSRPLIQKYTKEFFEQFNFNYSDLIIDEDFNVEVYGSEGESNLDMVSGGEKIAIALALRLGITQSMSHGNIETIMLDEPTIHLDSYRRHELIDIIRAMSVLPQMLIVTHDLELETAADNILIVTKENGVSEVKTSSE